MAQKVRYTLTLDSDIRDYFIAMAKEHGISFDEIVARGIRALHIAREQRRVGRMHLGFVSDRTKLDAELLLFV